MEASTVMGVAQKWMVSFMDNPTKMDDNWGYPHEWKLPYPNSLPSWDMLGLDRPRGELPAEKAEKRDPKRASLGWMWGICP